MNRTDYPKIDIFTRHSHNRKTYFAYACSTTWSKTCKEAVARYIAANPLAYPSARDVKARFARI